MPLPFTKQHEQMDEMPSIRNPFESAVKRSEKYALEDYRRHLRKNRYDKLEELRGELPCTDPLQVYQPVYSRYEQEGYFDKGVETYGGNFVSTLRQLYIDADPDNRLKIRRTWPGLWVQYVGMGIHKEYEGE